MGRLSNAEKARRLIKPTHEIVTSVNGALPSKSAPVSYEGAVKALDGQEKAVRESLRQATRVSKTRLEVKTGYGLKIVEVLPL